MWRSGGRTDCVGLTKFIELSSNGKTPDFGSGNRGSNPRGSTNTKSNLYNSAHKIQTKFAVRGCSSEGWIVAPTGNWFVRWGCARGCVFESRQFRKYLPIVQWIRT